MNTLSKECTGHKACRRQKRDREFSPGLHGRLPGGGGTWLSLAAHRYCENVHQAGVWVHALGNASLCVWGKKDRETQANGLLLMGALPSLPFLLLLTNTRRCRHTCSHKQILRSTCTCARQESCFCVREVSVRAGVEGQAPSGWGSAGRGLQKLGKLLC